ncbi:MAG: kynureninase [Saprospiraceae bacterium]|nr:kynureninase [Saprospiraceae bacterium]
MLYEDNLPFAKQMDAQDPLRGFKDQFHFPKHHDGSDTLYFCGNSLGLQPKNTEGAIAEALAHWRQYGVEGWFLSEKPWLSVHRDMSELAAPIVGAKPDEVVIMNTLTVNLHLLMVSFYRPTTQRFKILMEAGAFPSDQYAVESQVRFHGLDPKIAIVEIKPRVGEDCLRTEDILQTIENEGDTLSLVLFGGINYYTGQFFDLQKITEGGHRVGARVGFDLAHAAGNVPLQLHDWGVDFAVWCGYKYLNSGPGSIAGAFVHERHFSDPHLPRFAGWWGYNESKRFQMEAGFEPMHGAAGWQISTAQIIPVAMHQASLQLFKEAGGMPVLYEKAKTLTGYLAFLLGKSSYAFKIITPSVSTERGSQLSVLTDENGKKLFDYLAENGVICDWREPNVIRLAPAPMYCSYEDVWRLGQLMK